MTTYNGEISMSHESKSFEHKGYQCDIVTIKRASSSPFYEPYGTKTWLNGYVTIPEGHFLHGKYYNRFRELDIEFKVHGGITFTGFIEREDKTRYFQIGFDTNHAHDWEDPKSEDYVKAEIESLVEQIIAIENERKQA